MAKCRKLSPKKVKKLDQNEKKEYNYIINIKIERIVNMKRKIYNDLVKWKETSIETPLMIIGARQIGKTYVINEFCKNEFKN